MKFGNWSVYLWSLSCCYYHRSLPVKLIPSKLPREVLTSLPILSDNLWRLGQICGFLVQSPKNSGQQQPQMSVVGETKILTQLLPACVWFQ